MADLSTKDEQTEATLRADLEALKAGIAAKRGEFESADLAPEAHETLRVELIGLFVKEAELRRSCEEIRLARERPAREAAEAQLAANGASFIEQVCALENMIDEAVVPGILKSIELDEVYYLSARQHPTGFTFDDFRKSCLTLVINRLRAKLEDPNADTSTPQGRGELVQVAIERVKQGGARLLVEHELKHSGEKAA